VKRIALKRYTAESKKQKMSEPETQEHKPKVSKLAIASFIFGVLSLFILAGEVRENWDGTCNHHQLLKFVPFLFSAVAGFIIGIIAITMILARGRKKLRGGNFAVVGLLAAGITLVLWGTDLAPRRKVPSGRRCNANLRGLGAHMGVYAGNDRKQKYPTTDRWCDLLIKYCDLDKKILVCPEALEAGNKSGSHYAMNPECGSNSPGDVVLLFETKGGWNQSGGAELLTAENNNGKGAFILFNDGHASFISVRDFNDLKWK
jgi:hypothetical protein